MAEVDPRFDPVFQRGYDPAKHGSKRARQADSPAPAEPARGEPASDPVGAAPSTPAPASSTEPASGVGETENAFPEDATLDDPPPRRIRYRLVLLLVSIGLLLGAGALVWQRVTADPLEGYYGSNPGILFRLQLVDALVTPLLVAGLTGVTLWLVLGALGRRDDA
jgi:hypothetical protein